MASLADEVLGRFLNFKLLFKVLATNCLDVELIEGTLQELRRDSKLLLQFLWQIKNDVRSEVEQLPCAQFREQLSGRGVARGCIELFGDESKLSLRPLRSQCELKTQGIELEVSCCEGQTLLFVIRGEGVIANIPTQIDSRFATVPPQVMCPHASGDLNSSML